MKRTDASMKAPLGHREPQRILNESAWACLETALSRIICWNIPMTGADWGRLIRSLAHSRALALSHSRTLALLRSRALALLLSLFLSLSLLSVSLFFSLSLSFSLFLLSLPFPLFLSLSSFLSLPFSLFLSLSLSSCLCGCLKCCTSQRPYRGPRHTSHK